MQLDGSVQINGDHSSIIKRNLLTRKLMSIHRECTVQIVHCIQRIRNLTDEQMVFDNFRTIYVNVHIGQQTLAQIQRLSGSFNWRDYGMFWFYPYVSETDRSKITIW